MISVKPTDLPPRRPPSPPAPATPLSSRQAKELASRIIKAWPKRSLFDARCVLEEHPELLRHKSALLDVVYEEYCQRVDNGSVVNANSFVKRFPSIQESLCRLLEAHAALSLEAGNLAELAASPIAWPQSGDLFLEFQLLEELGRGAFSRVFLAAEPALGQRQVVVKVCRRGNIEADTLGQLLHPHIVPVYSVRNSNEAGLTAICMPFLSRATLQDALDFIHGQGRPPRTFAEVLEAIESLNREGEAPRAGRRSQSSDSYIDAIIRLAVQIAEAISYTHRRGVLHSDIKPSNILVTSAGDGLLFDFNLAAAPGKDTRVGGTLPYMAPEQLRRIASREGQASGIDPRTDVFSFGVTFYQLLCGAHPYGELPLHAAPREVADCLLERQAKGPAPLAAKNLSLDPKLARVIERCLAFDASQRPADAESLAIALRKSLSWPRRLHRSARLHRRALLAGCCATGMAFLAGGYGWATSEPFALRELRSGGRALRGGDWDAATAAFSRVIDVDRQSLDAYFGRGLAHLRAGRLGPAYDDLHFISTRVEHGAVSGCLGDCLTRMGVAEKEPKRFVVAIGYYEESRARQFVNLATLNNLGFCYLNATRIPRHLDLAEKALHEAAGLDRGGDGGGIVFLNLASIDRKRAVHDGGSPPLGNIDAAMRREPDLPEAEVEAAILYAMAAGAAPQGTLERQERLEKAAHCCQRSVEMGVALSELEMQIAPYADEVQRNDWLRILSRPAAATVALNPSVRILNSLDAHDLAMPFFAG